MKILNKLIIKYLMVDLNFLYSQIHSSLFLMVKALIHACFLLGPILDRKINEQNGKVKQIKNK